MSAMQSTTEELDKTKAELSAAKEELSNVKAEAEKVRCFQSVFNFLHYSILFICIDNFHSLHSQVRNNIYNATKALGIMEPPKE